MRITIRTILFGLICCVQFMSTNAQQLMTNVYGRNRQLLNGKWAAIIDPYRHGHKNSIYKDKPLKSQFDFKEYSWNGGLRLNVPGDWNSQMPELNYYEGTIWYAKRFNVIKNPERRLCIYFGAVNYLCSIYLNGKQIYLNDNPIFIKGISFHEEIAQRKGRAYSEQDAVALLSEAKALGANLVRLAHYPQNEYIVRMAERMGIMLWEEIPLWQNIDFGNEQTLQKAIYMQNEMIMRDRNRCAVSFWGLANETAPSAARNSFLKHLAKNCLKLDASRLTTAAFDKITWDEPTLTFYLDDPVTEFIDVVSINKYMGWYHKWPTKPANVHWDVCQQKPLVISEFGGEALYGQTGEYPNDWSEDYQAQLYKDNLEMFSHITNLAGISPWVLFDFRSPYRFQPLNQNGWNRKGLVSDQGFRKKAWYIMNDFYNKR